MRRSGFVVALALLAQLFVPACAKRLARVKHLTRVKIVESNTVTTRPGSVYDNITYFESIANIARPHFNYEFIDTGLGVAEPLYPMAQAGHQGSWAQLLPAFFSEDARHIDHFTSLEVTEGCRVDSVYMLRHISEFPEGMYEQERAEGYPLIVIRLEHYTRLHPEAMGGRHRLNDPDPDFDPMRFMKAHLDARSLADFPQDDLARFEAKVSAIRHIDEQFIDATDPYPVFDETKLERNSLWYYPQGHAFDYGIQEQHPQQDWPLLTHAGQLVHPAPELLHRSTSLADLLAVEEFEALLGFLCGAPHPGFDPATEPGLDTLDIRSMTPGYHIYSSGVQMERIRDARTDVAEMTGFRMVGLSIRPYQQVEDVHFPEDEIVPQVRLVFQMMSPDVSERAVEQLYLHLSYDAIDRYADRQERQRQHAGFMDQVTELAAIRLQQPDRYPGVLAGFVEQLARRPVERLSFSSSLTGIWVFGALTRTNNVDGELRPYRIVREGIDVGFYSTTYDNDLFRSAAANAEGERKRRLERHLRDLTVEHYRDEKRLDAGAIRFDRMTCAQCHQMSGRDAVHMAINDGIDPRFVDPVRASEFLFHELGDQLSEGQGFWTWRAGAEEAGHRPQPADSGLTGR